MPIVLLLDIDRDTLKIMAYTVPSCLLEPEGHWFITSHRIKTFLAPNRQFNNQEVWRIIENYWLRSVPHVFLAFYNCVVSGEIPATKEPPPFNNPAWNGTCGGTLIVPVAGFQKVQSPNYPMPYSNNMDCVWYLQTDQPGRFRIGMETNEFFTETGYVSKLMIRSCSSPYVVNKLGLMIIMTAFIIKCLTSYSVTNQSNHIIILIWSLYSGLSTPLGSILVSNIFKIRVKFRVWCWFYYVFWTHIILAFL